MLLDRTGAKTDSWTRSEGAATGNLARVLVDWEALPQALSQKEPDQTIGAVVPNSLPAAEIRLVMRKLGLIAIRFPAYSDGRGFSLAKRLRSQGYTGTLRASGPLIADQFAYALACGFDEIELDDATARRQPVEQWLKAVGQISHGYQRGYGDPRNILDQRRAARLAEGA